MTNAALTATAPSVPPPGPWPLPLSGPISLVITPDELSVSASMRPGTYLFDEPLRVQVISGGPGWYIQVHATSLKSKDNEIGPEDIHIVAEQRTVALDQPLMVAQDGDVGETTIEALIEVQTTQRHKPGTYTGQLFVIAGYSQGPPEVINVPIEVEVACSLSGSIRGNKMYFHYGLPGESLSATVEGEISADAEVRLSLLAEGGRVDHLPMIKSVSSNNRRENSSIPLVWALRENSTGWREPDRISFDGGEISWEITTDSEKVFYELQCRPQPDAAQAPGDYAMCVVMTMAPVL